MAMGYARLATSVADRAAKAEPLAERAISLGGTSPAVQNEVGLVFGRLNAYDRAMACWRRATELNPACDEPYRNLGLGCRYLEEPRLAAEAWRRAAALQPHDPSIRVLLGGLYSDLREYQESIDVLTQAIDLDPQEADAYYGLGVAWYDLGHKDRAIAAWRRATDLEPGYRSAHCMLGVAYQDLGRHEEAIASLQRAASLGNDGEVAFAIGLSCYHLGRYEQAVTWWKQGAGEGYSEPELHYYLGKAQLSLGQLDSAWASFAKALPGNRNQVQVTEITHYLAGRGQAGITSPAGRSP
jgi:superkiller protein 3